MTKGCSRELCARFWSWAPRARPLYPKLALPGSSLVSAPWLGKLRDGLWLYDLSESWRPQRLKARQGRKERKKLKFLCRDAICAHVRPQRLRDHHGPIRLLIILQDRKPCPPDSQAATVQSMHKVSLSLALRSVANIRPPRLECLEIRARRNLAEQPLSRQPHFNVICFSG